MPVPNAVFDTVTLNEGGPNACSPAAPPLPWEGVVIQAPTEVGFRPGRPVDGQFAAIPVCGFFQLALARLLDSKGLLLVAVDLKTGTRHEGLMLDEDPGLPEPGLQPPPLQPEALRGMVTSAYFNPNLARYVKLPAREATYAVHAEHGGAVSNVVKIAVVRR